MTPQEYRRTVERDLIGRQYRLTRDVANYYGTIARGTIVVITGKFGGLGIRTIQCTTCGVSLHASKVDPSALGDRID